MLKFIGFCTVVWALFYFGIMQLIALWIMVALSWVVAV